MRQVIDREVDSSFTFTLLAVDGGSPSLTSSANVTVTVVDVNDNAPTFTQTYFNTEVGRAAVLCGCLYIMIIITLIIIIIIIVLVVVVALTAELEKKIQTTELRCFRRLLGISYRDHVTNEKVRNRIRQAIGPYEDLLTTVKKRKLRWYGHKTRSTGLAKMILQGTVQGGRRRGRQKKRWEDNITEWTRLKLGEALRRAGNREEWRTVVARSSLVPQRSNRLWDK